LDGPFPKLCPAVALSHQDGRHSVVVLLLKAALIQVSDYRMYYKIHDICIEEVNMANHVSKETII
jgi:hypothetical protein